MQLGERGYGIARAGGPLTPDSIGSLLDLAARRGVDVLDTAPAYGDAEEILGRLLPADAPFRIVTKTRVFGRPIRPEDARTVTEDLRRSLERLRRGRIAGLLVHEAGDLLDDGGGHIFDALERLKEEGAVARIGVSVYEARQLDGILGRYAVDVVQAPVNLLDQRLPREGRLEKMKARGIEVHVRSLFLQGLLLMDPERVPAHFDAVREHLRRCDARTRERGLTRLQAALAFVRGLGGCDVAICGVDSPVQLEEICRALAELPETDDVDWSGYRIDDPRIVDPRRWPSGKEPA